jgi:DNA-binding protein HU-beta
MVFSVQASWSPWLRGESVESDADNCTHLALLVVGFHILACPITYPSSQERGVNKQDLVTALAKRLALSKTAAAKIVETVFGTSGLISQELRKGNKVQITGFGNFETRRRAPRRGRDPQTGESINIKATMVPAFRAGKGLKDLVNKKR